MGRFTRSLEFGHAPTELRFWRGLVGPLTEKCPTPFYLFSIEPMRAALAELDRHFAGLPVRHWLSCKTQPLPALLSWWRRAGRPIEVVSETELRAALEAGFAPGRILVNGPAKQRWLAACAQPGLCVNFDSPAEVRALAALARPLRWTCGVRLQTGEEFDPETPRWPTQFGMTAAELAQAMSLLRRNRVTVDIVHFHLRTNVASASIYERALRAAAAMSRAAGLTPAFVDCGGGFPAPHVLSLAGRPVDAGFRLGEMAGVLRRAWPLFPSARELWLENGRWLSGRSGALVVRILDVKDRGAMRHLICDGGRTMNAMVSTWEQHELLSLPPRRGRLALTTVHGPTCMAFDKLARRNLPAGLRAGDHLVWLDAGAYHLGWETRFSHELAAIYWHEGRRIRCVRRGSACGAAGGPQARTS